MPESLLSEVFWQNNRFKQYFFCAWTPILFSSQNLLGKRQSEPYLNPDEIIFLDSSEGRMDLVGTVSHPG
jgi:hypothetical protein